MVGPSGSQMMCAKLAKVSITGSRITDFEANVVGVDAAEFVA